MARQGAGYLGTSKIETSQANTEVIPSPPAEKKWTMGYSLYKFNFMNFDECKVLINNETTIYLNAGQGFQMNEIDRPITSFKILDSGIRYQYIGAY